MIYLDLLILFRHKFHNIIHTAAEDFADFAEGFDGDVFALAHFGDGIVTDIRRFREVFFLHIVVDQKLPKFFIADSHNCTSL